MAQSVRDVALSLIADQQPHLVATLVERFGISRQAVHRHLGTLVREGLLTTTGETRARRYHPVLRYEVERTFASAAHLPDEHRLWGELMLAQTGLLRPNVAELGSYVFTEILNNAFDHGDAQTITVVVRLFTTHLQIEIGDDGIGIFTKIRTTYNLANDHEAILELSKGRLTTDPSRHSGEGVFFSSRAADEFVVSSAGLELQRSARGERWSVAPARELAPGTRVSIRINLATDRELEVVFAHYTNPPDSYSFQRTDVVVGLGLAPGETLISRSQAKRVAARLERFTDVTLDFTGIKSVGPAFTDELFRVFQADHPEVRLRWINAGPYVAGMIRKALEARADQSLSLMQALGRRDPSGPER